MKYNIEFISGGAKLLDKMTPLRKKLLSHHAGLTKHFKSDFTPDRIKKTNSDLRACDRKKKLKVDLVKEKNSGRYVGYCVTKINKDNSGEIFSIFVDAKYRNMKIGHQLMQRALSWLEERKAENKILHVLAENKRAMSFYKRYGFYPRTIVLKKKNAK